MGEDLPQHMEATRAERQALEAWLQSLSEEELLAELRGLLDEDRDLRRRFELRAAAMNSDALTIRRAVMEFIVPASSIPISTTMRSFWATGALPWCANASWPPMPRTRRAGAPIT
jgi:hypothetical protein